MITSTLPTFHGLRGRVVGAAAVVALAGLGAGPLASGASAGTSSRNRVTAVSMRLLVSDGEVRARQSIPGRPPVLRLCLNRSAAVVSGDDGGSVLGQERVHQCLARRRLRSEAEGHAERDHGQ